VALEAGPPLSKHARPAAERVPHVSASSPEKVLRRGPGRELGLIDRLLSRRGWLWTRLIADAALLILAVLAARIGAPEAIGDDGTLLVWALPPIALVVFAQRGLYGGAIESRAIDTVLQIVGSTSLVAISLIAAAALFNPDAEPGPLVARTWLFATLYVAGGRILLTAVLRRAHAAEVAGKPTLIVGAGQVGAEMEHRLREDPGLGLRLLGYLDADPPPAEKVPGRTAPVLGGPGDLVRIAQETGAEHVILSFSSAPDHGLVPLVRECEANGMEVSLVPRMFESLTKRLQFEQIGTLPLMGLRSVHPRSWQFSVKYGLDRCLAALLLALLAPVLLAVALAVRASSPGPVLFRQRRIGRDGRAFDMFKFRSMHLPASDLRDTIVELPAGVAPGGVEGDDRRTAVGRFLRRYSLDELPQLINVLNGDMSLVGPRPERPEFAELFGQTVLRYDDRHRVKSGITGWAQINGLRGRTSLSDRVRWDNYYIQNWSLGLDLKILLLTVATIFRAPGD
jgi:exopolysaccharide biosynthesis polyprenyl glycosylphosphotransferase